LIHTKCDWCCDWCCVWSSWKKKKTEHLD